MNPFTLPAFASHQLVLLHHVMLVHVCIAHVPDQVCDCVCGPCVPGPVLNMTLANHDAVAQLACHQVSVSFTLLRAAKHKKVNASMSKLQAA